MLKMVLADCSGVGDEVIVRMLVGKNLPRGSAFLIEPSDGIGL
jgi:hypothetical protein